MTFKERHLLEETNVEKLADQYYASKLRQVTLPIIGTGIGGTLGLVGTDGSELGALAGAGLGAGTLHWVAQKNKEEAQKRLKANNY